MPRRGVPGYLKYRVLDSNTGAVVIPDLPHPHQSTWTVYAPQKGYPGATSIGTFRIPLYSPLDKRNFPPAQPWYSLLAVGQRVEGFLGDVITGTPRFSGVITPTNFKQSLKAPWEIGGSDTLYWLQQSQALPGEMLSQAGTPSIIVLGLLGTQEVVRDDGFPTSAGVTANYANTGWSWNGSDPFLKLPNVQVVGGGGSTATLISNSTWARANQFTDCAISLHGTVVFGTSNTQAANFGILLNSDGTGANAVLVNAQFAATAGGAPWSVNLAIYTIAAGVLTQQAQVANVMTGLQDTMEFELTAQTTLQGGSTFLRALLNGKDPGVTYNLTTLLPGVSPGSVGIRSAPAAGGSPALYVNRLQFHGRTSNPWSGGTNFGTNRFASGTITASSIIFKQPIPVSGMSQLDMLLLMSELDGVQLRKTAGFGFKADVIDYASGLGVDRSSQIVFEEGVNVEDAEVGSVGEVYATDLRLVSIPGAVDSGGSIVWSRLGAAGDMVLTNTVADIGVPGYQMLMSHAPAIQARMSNPVQARSVDVVRTADTADVWRELDFVGVHVPTIGINHEKDQIVGYTFTEGAVTQRVFLSQMPGRAFPQAQINRLTGPIEWLGNTYLNR